MADKPLCNISHNFAHKLINYSIKTVVHEIQSPSIHSLYPLKHAGLWGAGSYLQQPWGEMWTLMGHAQKNHCSHDQSAPRMLNDSP